MFCHQNRVSTSSIPIRATVPTNLIFPDLTSRKIFNELWKWRRKGCRRFSMWFVSKAPVLLCNWRSVPWILIFLWIMCSMLVVMGNFLTDSYYIWFCLMNQRNLLMLNVFFRPDVTSRSLRILSPLLLYGFGLAALYFALVKYSLQFCLNSSMLSSSSSHK